MYMLYVHVVNYGDVQCHFILLKIMSSIFKQFKQNNFSLYYLYTLLVGLFVSNKRQNGWNRSGPNLLRQPTWPSNFNNLASYKILKFIIFENALIWIEKSAKIYWRVQNATFRASVKS